MNAALLALALGAYSDHAAFLLGCHDGDTCDMVIHNGRDSWSQESIRFCNLYAPELKEPGGLDSRDHLVDALAPYRLLVVRIPKTRTGRERQSFGRVMGWVMTPTGLVFNELMVLERRGRLPKAGEPRCPLEDRPNKAHPILDLPGEWKTRKQP